MTYATTFLVISFIAEVVLSMYYLWTANEMPKVDLKSKGGQFQALGLMAAGWKKSWLLFVISLLLYFIFYGALMTTMTDVTNIYRSDSSIMNTIKTEDWRLGWEYLKIMMGLVGINFGVLCWRFMNQTRIMVLIFGPAAKKSKKWIEN